MSKQALILTVLLAFGFAAAAQSTNPSPPVNSPGLALAVAAPLGASAGAGWLAEGTGTAYSAQGPRTVRVELALWGAAHSRLTVIFPGGLRYEAIVDGKRAVSRGPQGWLALPPAGGVRGGCILLPQGLLLADAATGGVGAADGGASPEAPSARRIHFYRIGASASTTAQGHLAAATAVAVDVEASTGLPERAEYTAGGTGPQAVRVEYARYRNAAGASYPAHVEEYVNGGLKLSVDFSSFAAHPGWTERDFAVPLAPPTPAPPPPALAGRGQR